MICATPQTRQTSRFSQYVPCRKGYVVLVDVFSSLQRLRCHALLVRRCSCASRGVALVSRGHPPPQSEGFFHLLHEPRVQLYLLCAHLQANLSSSDLVL
jgi:hypothetical protein